MRLLRILPLFFLLLASYGLQAQSYLTAGGLRLGNTWGLTVVQRVLPQVSVEGIIQNDYRQTTNLTVLGRVHNNIISRRWNLYYGGGFHTGINTETGGILGVDGVAGIELSLLRLNLSFDFKPQVDFGENGGFRGHTAFSIRYVLVKGNAIKKWQRKRQKQKRQDNKDKWIRF
jgi:hypothetical protein